MMDEHRSRTGTTVGQDIGLSIKVTDYYFVQDGDYFDRHFFIVTVVAENIKFSVDRSYVDFVEFDRLLRKKFPETHFRPLPLEHAVLLKSVLQRYAPTDAKLGSGLFIKQMYQADPTSELFRIPEGQGGEVASKQDALSDYLCELLLKHEVVASEEIRHFLDEERRGMLGQELDEPLSVHDLLLISAPVSRSVVHRTEEYQMQVTAGQLVVYRFSTKDFDIGFSAEMNSQVRVPYTRSASHRSPVLGILEASESALCTLKWDNSYAKLHTKQLSWSMRVVSAEEFGAAKTQTMEVQREKKRFEQQRYAVQRATLRFAAELSGVIHESLPDHPEELLAELEGECCRLREEVATLLGDLGRAEESVDELGERLRAAEEAKQNMADSWHFATSQLQAAEQEIDELHAELEQREGELDELESELRGQKQALLEQDKRSYETQGEVTREAVRGEGDSVHRQRRLMELQKECRALTGGGGGGGGEGGWGELVERLLVELQASNAELDRKNQVVRNMGQLKVSPSPPPSLPSPSS